MLPQVDASNAIILAPNGWNAAMDVDELVENFEMLGPWDERYRYLIELGRKLPPMPEADKNEANKVRGCMSQVWLTGGADGTGHMVFAGDSDAFIVKGLIALLFKIVSGRSAQDVLDLDIAKVFGRLGLENHVTANRRNGFYAMVERIRGMSEDAVGSK